MLINKVSSLNICCPQKNNTNQNKNSMTFKAKKLPSGDYSDWFFRLVQSKAQLQDSTFRLFSLNHLSDLKQRLRGGWWSIFKRLSMSEEQANARLIRRETALGSLRQDLRQGHAPEDLGHKPYDYPVGRYATKEEYEHDPPPPPREDFEPPRSDYDERDGLHIGICPR